MALKTFNVSQEIYLKFSRFCKENGISMSRQVETFMASQVEEEPKAREAYLRRLDALRKGKFIPVKSFASRYRLEK
jgi:hypothetical protein